MKLFDGTLESVQIRFGPGCLRSDVLNFVQMFYAQFEVNGHLYPPMSLHTTGLHPDFFGGFDIRLHMQVTQRDDLKLHLRQHDRKQIFKPSAPFDIIASARGMGIGWTRWQGHVQSAMQW